jgi:hypothetical protein
MPPLRHRDSHRVPLGLELKLFLFGARRIGLGLAILDWPVELGPKSSSAPCNSHAGEALIADLLHRHGRRALLPLRQESGGVGPNRVFDVIHVAFQVVMLIIAGISLNAPQ